MKKTILLICFIWMITTSYVIGATNTDSTVSSKVVTSYVSGATNTADTNSTTEEPYTSATIWSTDISTDSTTTTTTTTTTVKTPQPQTTRTTVTTTTTSKGGTTKVTTASSNQENTNGQTGKELSTKNNLSIHTTNAPNSPDTIAQIITHAPSENPTTMQPTTVVFSTSKVVASQTGKPILFTPTTATNDSETVQNTAVATTEIVTTKGHSDPTGSTSKNTSNQTSGDSYDRELAIIFGIMLGLMILAVIIYAIHRYRVRKDKNMFLKGGGDIAINMSKF